jgi:hypothetical protein
MIAAVVAAMLSLYKHLLGDEAVTCPNDGPLVQLQYMCRSLD